MLLCGSALSAIPWTQECIIIACLRIDCASVGLPKPRIFQVCRLRRTLLRWVFCNSANTVNIAKDDTSNKFAFSYLRRLTTWHCPHSSAAAAAVDRYHLPAGPTAANLQQPGLLPWAHAGTDSRTDTVPFDRPCSAYYAGSANNQQDSRCLFIYLNISGKGCKPLICR